MAASRGTSEYATVTDVIRKDRDRALAAAAKQATEVAPELLVDADALTGSPAQAVTESGSGALMLVVGSRGGGAFTAMLLGSVSRYAASHAPCPVVVVREETTAARRQIGVGVGNLDDCAGTLDFAFTEAAARTASVVAIHAWHSADGRVSPAASAAPGPSVAGAEAEAARQLEGLLAEWQDKYPGVLVSQDVVHGHPGRVLAGLSARADMVVIGRNAPHGHGLPGPGAVRHALLGHAHGPVVVVPAP
jgi:nucleotide-binding universal stress UspA family protein